jgi:MarR family transcriptional regulator, temperature-dependent positive regulator of motility
MDKIDALLRRNKINYVYRLGYLSNHLIGAVYRKSESDLGIQRPHFAVLLCLSHLNDITATDVVRLTGIPKNSISRAINALLESGYISRDSDEEDGRRGVLNITPRGKAVYDDIAPSFRQRQKKMLEVLSTDERETLNRLLTKLVSQEPSWAD